MRDSKIRKETAGDTQRREEETGRDIETARRQKKRQRDSRRQGETEGDRRRQYQQPTICNNS